MKRFFTFPGLRLLVISMISFYVLISSPVSAQEFVSGGKNDFSWRLIGRVFFDGGTFWGDTLGLGNSFQVNDVRLGTVIRFMENWEAKIELGYADNKITFKDIFLDYKYGDHNFRLGYQYEPFGYARIGTSNFRFMTESVAERALGNGRKLGLSYSLNRDWLNVMGGVYSDGDIQKSRMQDQGYVITGKVVGRPMLNEQKLIHIGVAPRFSSGRNEVTFTAGAPTDLLDKSENTFVNASINQVINQWKMDAEMILLYNKWYFHGQYFLAHLNRSTIDNYNGKGGYAQIGYMILGDKHNYNAATAMLVNPDPQSLEILMRYNHVNLNDGDIRGGRMSDLAIEMNYFFNKYVAAKLNYTRIITGHSSTIGKDNFNLIQARVQLSF